MWPEQLDGIHRARCAGSTRPWGSPHPGEKPHCPPWCRGWAAEWGRWSFYFQRPLPRAPNGRKWPSAAGKRDARLQRGLPRMEFWASKESWGSSGFVRRHLTKHAQLGTPGGHTGPSITLQPTGAGRPPVSPLPTLERSAGDLCQLQHGTLSHALQASEAQQCPPLLGSPPCNGTPVPPCSRAWHCLPVT